MALIFKKSLQGIALELLPVIIWWIPVCDYSDSHFEKLKILRLALARERYIRSEVGRLVYFFITLSSGAVFVSIRNCGRSGGMEADEVIAGLYLAIDDSV